MKYDTIILGNKVKFLNPPGNSIPNITFVVVPSESEDNKDLIDKWYDIYNKMTLEMYFNTIILDTKTWITGYIQPNNDGTESNSNLVTVNYRTISPKIYAEIMLRDLIRRYPIDNDLVHDYILQIKYLYTIDFVHTQNKGSIFITNGFFDIIMSMVYLPELDDWKNITSMISERMCRFMIDKLMELNLIPKDYFPKIEAHAVGYDRNTQCAEMVVMLKGINYDDSGDYYAIEELNRDYFSIDVRILEDQTLFKALSNATFMDNCGFDVVNNLDTATDRPISIYETNDDGKDLITFVPTFDRYEIHEYEINLDDDYTKLPNYNENAINYYKYDNQLFSNYGFTEYRPINYVDNHPISIIKVGWDNYVNCVNKKIPYTNKLASRCDLFALDANNYWFAWYK